VGAVPQPVLDQVTAPAHAQVEKRAGVGDVGVLAEQDDAGCSALRDLEGQLDTADTPGLRRDGVREHDFEPELVDRGEEVRLVRRQLDDLELGRPRKQAPQPLAPQKVFDNKRSLDSQPSEATFAPCESAVKAL
jgi:hypothetical protein